MPRRFWHEYQLPAKKNGFAYRHGPYLNPSQSDEINPSSKIPSRSNNLEISCQFPIGYGAAEFAHFPLSSAGVVLHKIGAKYSRAASLERSSAAAFSSVRGSGVDLDLYAFTVGSPNSNLFSIP